MNTRIVLVFIILSSLILNEGIIMLYNELALKPDPDSLTSLTAQHCSETNILPVFSQTGLTRFLIQYLRSKHIE